MTSMIAIAFVVGLITGVAITLFLISSDDDDTPTAW
jgi:hypothetical protein